MIEPRPSTFAPRGSPLAVGIAAAVALLVLPLPSPALDVLLTAQLAAGVVVLWIAATARAPSRLVGLPVALLVLTLFRLALNVATTRAILARGEAGRVVEAFGDALVGGDLFVGLAVFAVVTLAQYVVVARGAGRVAEVAARFALDALPGRQQAIEAELGAGLLDAEGARRRRDALDRTSGLYGAMDGVMRFVRGDAVAGLCIVGVNIFGGLAIGVGRRDLGLGDALATYTVLTVGDGLASQVPAVLGTAAAAVLATRLASPERGGSPLGPALAPALGGAAMLFGALALMPGLPGWPLLVVAGGLALGARTMGRARPDPPPRAVVPAEERPDPALSLALHPAALDALGGRVEPALDRARGILLGFGVRSPTVSIDAGAVDVPPSGYRIEIGGAPAARGLVMPGQVFVCPCPADRPGLGGRHPEHDAPGRWVARGAGIDPVEYVAAHLAATWRRDPAALALQTVAARVERLDRSQPALVRAVVPKRLSLEALAGVLRGLLAEDVPVCDLPRILEALAAQPEGLTIEQRRADLRRSLRPWLAVRLASGRWLAVIYLAAQCEAALMGQSLGGDGLEALVEGIDRVRAAHPRAALVVADRARVAARSLIGELRPGLTVLGHRELDPGLSTRMVGFVDPFD